MPRLTAKAPSDPHQIPLYSASLASPVGNWHITACAKGVAGISLDPPSNAHPHYTAAAPSVQSLIAGWLAPLTAYLAQNGDPGALGVIPLWVQGTDFQLAVWQTLRAIAWGQSASYKQLALNIDRPNSYRALANACGANPVGILIPCHRATATKGFGGFRWGLAAKRFLVECERAVN
jgi:O-6-methylguanine DNA methyltransferase